jgi:hypothetical protein
MTDRAAASARCERSSHLVVVVGWRAVKSHLALFAALLEARCKFLVRHIGVNGGEMRTIVIVPPGREFYIDTVMRW